MDYGKKCEFSYWRQSRPKDMQNLHELWLNFKYEIVRSESVKFRANLEDILNIAVFDRISMNLRFDSLYSYNVRVF